MFFMLLFLNSLGTVGGFMHLDMDVQQCPFENNVDIVDAVEFQCEASFQCPVEIPSDSTIVFQAEAVFEKEVTFKAFVGPSRMFFMPKFFLLH